MLKPTMILLAFSLFFTLIYLFGLFLRWWATDYGHLIKDKEFPIFRNVYCFCRSRLLNSVSGMEKFLESNADNEKGVNFCWIYGRRGVVMSSPHLLEKMAYNPTVTKPACVFEAFTPYNTGLTFRITADDNWKLRRKEVNSTMKKGFIEGSYYDHFVEFGKSFVEAIKKEKSEFDLGRSSLMTTINTLFVTHCDAEEKILNKDSVYISITMALHELARCIANPILGSFILSSKLLTHLFFKSFMKYVTQICVDVTKKLEDPQKSTKLHENIEGKPGLPLNAAIGLRQIKQNQVSIKAMEAELTEFLLVGAHTTSVVLTSSIVFMAALPEIQEKVWQEQNEIFGRDDWKPTVADLRQMHYLDRFLKETIRFVGLPLLGRYTTEDLDLGDGIVIPKHTVILLLLRKMRMDPLYVDNPNVFDPDRFIHEETLPKYARESFGFDVRSCPGKQYAMTLLKVVLSIILRSFRFTTKLKFEDIKLETKIMIEIETFTGIVEAHERKWD